MDRPTPRIFISHAWEDKKLTRRLEDTLKEAGVDVWVDHSEIRAGHNLPKRISNALEWCNILLLLWSNAASNSHWVELEWTNAISLGKVIIPCILDNTKLPGILSNIAYLEFDDLEKGIKNLIFSLNFADSSISSVPKESTEQIARVLHDHLTKASKPVKPKPAQFELVLRLRSQPIDGLAEENVIKMLKTNNFFDIRWNNPGTGINHKYETVEHQLVIDHSCGLTWQQNGSKTIMDYYSAKYYINKLNKENYAGYNNWRLPTIEEAMSLMEPEKKKGHLYINSVFSQTQSWLWTADRKSDCFIWVVHFYSGICELMHNLFKYYIRAVRTI